MKIQKKVEPVFTIKSKNAKIIKPSMYAFLEDTDIMVFRVKNGRVVTQELKYSDLPKIKKESYVSPVGLVITHTYDQDGYKHPVTTAGEIYYQGEKFDPWDNGHPNGPIGSNSGTTYHESEGYHPFIPILAKAISHKDYNYQIENVLYENGMYWDSPDEFMERKKKSAKPKPKRKVVKKPVKKCRCKK